VGVGVFGAACAGVYFLANASGMTKPLKEMFGSPNTGIVTQTVRRGELRITVVEKGTLESAKNQDAFCNVEGGTTIISIKPEGAQVKKGELVCELDSAALRDSLTNQQITTKSADANFRNATLTREVAEQSVKEYEEGIYKQDLATAEGEIKLAESELSRLLDRVDWAQRMFVKGYVSMAAKVSEDLALKKARFSLEQAQGKKKVLVDFTRDKMIKELRSEVEKAASDELAKKATWTLETSKEKKLERQIAACKILAPSDGLVVYANDPTRAFMSNTPQVEEGAQVRERQKIFSLPDIGQMQVNTKVHESHINKVKRGMKAKIRVDAYSNELLDGEVTDVAALPDTASFFSSDIKVYTTKVRILSPLPGLRPGMNAEVTIEVNQLDKVLSVPVLAVLEFGGQTHVTKKTDGRFVQTTVELGLSNEKYVEVKSGVNEGDIVAMSPISLMSEEAKRAAFGSMGKPTPRDWSKDESAEVAAVAAAGAAKGKAGGAAGKGKASGKARGKAGGAMAAVFAKMANLSDDERQQLRSPELSMEERTALLKKAGLTDEEISQMAQMRARGGGRGGMGGPGGGGRGRGGFGRGGGPPGGGDGGSDQ
jgi:HlyD family secretion protein